MTLLKKLLLHVLVSLAVIGWWRLLTETDNYAWFPKGKELLILGFDLTVIFVYKASFWLVLVNLAVYAVGRLINKGYRAVAAVAIAGVVFYFVVGRLVDINCASAYYRVFANQSVSEEYLERPIKQAGYEIGPIITGEIKNKNMELRRYAIAGIADIRYYPATEALKQILFDKSEDDYIRADAFVVLTKFDTTAAKEVLADFKESATDSTAKKVVGLGNYFLHADS